MDGGSADHAGAGICRPAGDRFELLRRVARMAGSYSVFTTALQSFQGFEGE
jgi:hypothetical protein